MNCLGAKPHLITAANRATPHNSSVNTDMGLIVLGRCTQDPRIPGEIALGQGGHYRAEQSRVAPET